MVHDLEAKHLTTKDKRQIKKAKSDLLKAEIAKTKIKKKPKTKKPKTKKIYNTTQKGIKSQYDAKRYHTKKDVHLEETILELEVSELMANWGTNTSQKIQAVKHVT